MSNAGAKLTKILEVGRSGVEVEIEVRGANKHKMKSKTPYFYFYDGQVLVLVNPSLVISISKGTF